MRDDHRGPPPLDAPFAPLVEVDVEVSHRHERPTIDLPPPVRTPRSTMQGMPPVRRFAEGSVETHGPFVGVAEAADRLGISPAVLLDVITAGGFKILRSPDGAPLLFRNQIEELRVELREAKRRARWSEGR